MWRWVLVAGIAACSDSDPVVDAGRDAPLPEVLVRGVVVPEGDVPSTIEYTLNGERGVMNGAFNRWELTFPSYEAALATEMIFEAWYDGALLDRADALRCGDESLCAPAPGDSVRQESLEMCGYPNGELRVFAVSCDYVEYGGCVADAFCPPRCHPSNAASCGDARKCSRIVTHTDPTFGVLDCVPDGDVALGDACSVGTAGRDTGYDDCAAGGICIDGTCVEACGPGLACSGGGACAPVDGLADGYGACL